MTETHRSEPQAPEQLDDDRMAGSAWRVSGLTLASRLLGLARDICLVTLFGSARGVLDAFLLAFTVPNLFRRVFGEGALTAAFVPVFVKVRETEGPEPAARLASAVFTLLALVTAGIAGAGMLLCLGLDQLVGFEDPVRLTLELLAVMLPFLCLICCAALLAAMLQSVRLFSLPAAMSIVLNLCFLVTFAFLAYGRGEDGLGFLRSASEARSAIFYVAAAVLVAGALQIVIQGPVLWLVGVRVRPSLEFGQPHVRAVLKGLGPTALGLGVVQVNVLIDNLIAGALAFGPEQGAGAVQYLYLGNRLMQLPLGVFGIAVATTAFPFLARHAARGDHKSLLEQLERAMRLVVFVVLPAAVGLGVLSDPLVRLIFQKPDLVFTDGAVFRTASVLTCYAGGLVFFSLQHLLTRVFYAREEFGTPVRVAMAMVVVNLVLNLVLVHAPDLYLSWSGTEIASLGRTGLFAARSFGAVPLGEAGLALATTCTALINVLILWHCLKRRLRPEAGAGTWSKVLGGLHWSVFRIGLAAGLMGVFVYFARNSIPYEPEFFARLERGLVPVVLGAVGYWIACLVIPVPELEEFARQRRKKQSSDRTDGKSEA